MKATEFIAKNFLPATLKVRGVQFHEVSGTLIGKLDENRVVKITFGANINSNVRSSILITLVDIHKGKLDSIALHYKDYVNSKADVVNPYNNPNGSNIQFPYTYIDKSMGAKGFDWYIVELSASAKKALGKDISKIIGMYK